MTTAKQKAKKKIDAKWDACVAMYEAVAAYVKINGGKVFISEGVQIQEWPGAQKGYYVVGIKCWGKKPGVAEHGK